MQTPTITSKMGNCLKKLGYPKDDDEKLDIVTALIGFPHILTDIFSAVSYKTLLAAEKVPSWNCILSLPGIWRTRRRKAMTMVSPSRKILLTRMEHRKPELFNRIKTIPLIEKPSTT